MTFINKYNIKFKCFLNDTYRFNNYYGPFQSIERFS